MCDLEEVTVNFRMSLVAALVMSSICVVPAHAVAPVVNDRGKFFSADAIKKANLAIRELYLNDSKDLLVETYESVPSDSVEKVKGMSREKRAEFFKEWAESRAKTRLVHGVYILICKDPTMIYVEVTPKVRNVIDESARNKLRDKLVEDFRAKNYDDGLANAVKFVKDRLGTK
jgi:uncharacterized membrane protein YgcG